MKPTATALRRVDESSVLSSPEVDIPPVDRHRRRYITAALAMVMVLASMEQTITSTAMPTIIKQLHGLAQYAMVTAIYLLACTVSMPLYGRLADKLGRKGVILSAISLFLAASLLAANARTMNQLIIFRGLQGLGAGGIMPVVLTILGDIFTLQERAQMQGLFSAIWGTASLVGPWLGARLVLWFGWNSIFYVNLPFGILSLVVLSAKYRDQEKPHPTDLDLPGVTLMALACGALLAWVSPFKAEGWSGLESAVLGVVAVVAGVLFVVNELRVEHPIMPPRLMLRREIGPSLLGSCLLGVAVVSLDTYVPLYVQGGHGKDAMAAAMVVTPVLLTWALAGIVVAPFLVRWGFRKLARVGTLLIVLAFSGLVICSIHPVSQVVFTAVLAVAGLGFAPASMSYLLSAQGAVEWQQRGIVTGTVQFCRTFGAAIGIAVLGILFKHLMDRRLGQIDAANLMDPRVQRAIVGSLVWVFVAMLVMAVVGVFVSLLMAQQEVRNVSTTEAMEAGVG